MRDGLETGAILGNWQLTLKSSPQKVRRVLETGAMTQVDQNLYTRYSNYKQRWITECQREGLGEKISVIEEIKGTLIIDTMIKYVILSVPPQSSMT